MAMAFLDLFHGALSSTNAQHREECEQKLMQLLHRPDKAFLQELCEFVSTSNEAVPYRQFACLMIRKFISAHWSSTSLEEDENIVGDMVFTLDSSSKDVIKQGLVNIVQRSLVQFSDSKLQTAFCMILATIVDLEAAEINQVPYENIFITVLSILSSACTSTCLEEAQLMMSFATRFLTLSVQNISNVHCCELANILFPHLQKAFIRYSKKYAEEEIENAVISCSTCCRIVRIVEQMLLAIGLEAQVGSETAQRILDQYLVAWCELFVTHLGSEHESMLLSVEIQVLNSLTAFFKEWPNIMAKAVPDLYRGLMSRLQNSLDLFNRDIVLAQTSSDIELSAQCSAELYDASHEGAELGRTAFAVACVDFFQASLLSATKANRNFIFSSIQHLWIVLIPYLVITEHQREMYAHDPNQYVVEEDSDLEYSLRRVAAEFLTELLSVFPVPRVEATEKCNSAVQSIVHAAQTYLASNSQYTEALVWRYNEASLFVLGNVANDGEATLQIVKDCLQIDDFVQNLINLIAQSVLETSLRCRALWCASHLMQVVSSNLLLQFLQVCLANLQATQYIPVRIYACRALALSVKASGKHQALKSPFERSQINAISMDAVKLFHDIASDCSPESVYIVLEALIVVVEALGDQIGADGASFIVNGFLQQWLKQPNDILILELLQNATYVLIEMQDPVIMGAVYEHTLPVIQSVLTNFSKTSITDSSTVAGTALTLLQSVLQRSCQVWLKMGEVNTELMVRELSDRIILQLLQPLIYVLDLADDEKVFNAGTECLKWLIFFAPQAIASSQHSSSINRIVQVANKLLDPTMNDACAASAGGLITQLLLKYASPEGPSLLPFPIIEAMLKAVASRLCTAELATLIQSLCMVFAKLIISYGKTVVHILENLPAPQSANGLSSTSKNMLEFVFRYWIEKQQDFFGLYCLKVTTKALIDVLDWRDERVLLLSVHHELDTGGDTSEAPGPRRSRRLQAQMAPLKRDTVIHFVSKLTIVLAKTFLQLQEEEEVWESASSCSEGGDQAPNDEDSENVSYLSNVLDDRDDSPEDDLTFEAHFDPLNRINVKQMISSTLQKLINDPAVFNYLHSELSKQDQMLLQSIVHSPTSN